MSQKIKFIKNVETFNSDRAAKIFDTLVEEKIAGAIKNKAREVSKSLLVQESDTGVKLDAAAVNEEFTQKYNAPVKTLPVIEKLQTISNANRDAIVIFENKEAIRVTPDTANAVLAMYGRLNKDNRAKLVHNISESKSGFTATVQWISEFE